MATRRPILYLGIGLCRGGGGVNVFFCIEAFEDFTLKSMFYYLLKIGKLRQNVIVSWSLVTAAPFTL